MSRKMVGYRHNSISCDTPENISSTIIHIVWCECFSAPRLVAIAALVAFSADPQHLRDRHLQEACVLGRIR